MAEVVALADYAVKIENEEFNICSIPDEKSKLVEAKKKVVLNNLNLNELVSSLKRSGSLLFLAYNGVAGFGDLRGLTSDLQDNLGKLCRDGELALDRFARNTNELLKKLQQNFKFLSEGKEKAALAFLGQCASTAKGMADEASGLAAKFDKLADDTMVVAGKTEVQQGKTDDEKRQLEKDLNDLKAKDAAAKKLSTELGDRKKRLQKLYDEAKAKAEKTADRAFAVQMVGAIMGPIAQGLGTFGGMYASAASGAGAAGAVRGALGGAAPNAPPAAPTPTSPEKKKAEKEIEDKKAAEAKAQTELDAAKKDLEKKEEEKKTAVGTAAGKATAETLAKEKADDAKGKADKEPTNSALKKTADDAKTAADNATKEKVAADKDQKTKEDAVTTAKKTVTDKEAALKTAADAAASAGKALETVANNLAAASHDMMDLVQTYEAEKQKYLDTLLKCEEQEAQSLANMADYAIRMTSVTDLVQVSKSVSHSLCQAIAAFHTVAQILRNAALFWTQMADACKALSSQGVQATVQAFSALDEKDRLDMWKAESFKVEAVEYMAQWKALELICRDYSKAAGETRVEVQNNLNKSPSPEESMKLTPELAKALLTDATRAKGAAEEKGAAIKSAMQPKAA